MASSELIVDDDYVNSMGAFFEKKGSELDKLVTQYLSILDTVKTRAIMSGEVSDALKVYITYVKKLKGKFQPSSSSLKTQTSNFLKSVDEKDQYLF